MKREELRDYIVARLMELQDLGYRDFHARLLPNLEKDRIIGVRQPALRKLAKDLSKQEGIEEFLTLLPHYYYEEKGVHSALIGNLAKTPQEALDMIDEFLPYVDNWATCDSLPPKILKKDLDLVRSRIMPWLDSDQTYRVRFAVVTMLSYLLEDGFRPTDLRKLASIKSQEYYINMAIAWYYSFALIKQYHLTIKLIEAKTLDKWIHNKSIQKAVESFRIDDEKKAYLKTLRMK